VDHDSIRPRSWWRSAGVVVTAPTFLVDGGVSGAYVTPL
jgi:hypothetical protein